MGLSVSLVLSLVRVVAVVNSFDSGTLIQCVGHSNHLWTTVDRLNEKALFT